MALGDCNVGGGRRPLPTHVVGGMPIIVSSYHHMVISSYYHDIIISSYRHITISYHHHVLAGSSTHWMSFLVKVQGKIRNRPFYPSPKSRTEMKLGSSGVIFRDGSASDAQNFIALPKQALCFFVLCFQQKSKKISVFDVETWNVGKHLKRVLAKFQANPSHPQGVNGRSKFAKNFEIFFTASKNETLRIVWNAFSQSFTPIGAIREG